MKQANSIISHIRSLPQFKLLKRHHCYQKFISSLAPKFQKAIAFVYVRDRTLFIALSHPGFKMELNYSKDILKDVLNMLVKIDKKCQALQVSNVVLFNSKHLSIIKKEAPQSMVPYYRELSLATFDIKSKDQEIINAFQEIKKSIKNQL
jgi:hypothetical protein